jgi:predicted unusual protein kinase regulating ubiquinone biosynthesis (AarF/ABC1/UbiB family)
LRNELGVALFRFYVGTLYQHGVFHADPHPGNYAFPEQGGLVIYDFGCVRCFERETVAAFARLLAALRSERDDELHAALLALGAHPPEAELAEMRQLLRGFFAPMLTPGARAIDAGAALAGKELLRDKRRLARLGLPGRFLFLFRLRFGLYAVLARLGAVADWAALEMRWGAALSPPAHPSQT